jgi:hypothetical protein
LQESALPALSAQLAAASNSGSRKKYAYLPVEARSPVVLKSAVGNAHSSNHDSVKTPSLRFRKAVTTTTNVINPSRGRRLDRSGEGLSGASQAKPTL